MTVQPRSAATTAKLLVVVMGFAWGFNWIATRIILSALPPWTMRTLGIGLGDGLRRDVGLHHGLKWRLGRNNEFPFHAGQPMSRHAAKVDVVASLGGGERNAGARAFADDVRRASRRSLIVKDDIVLGTLAVDQRHLNNLAFRSGQQGIDLTVD